MFKSTIRAVFLAAMGAGLLCPPLQAGNWDYLAKPRTIACPHVDQPPVIDGKLDDACWKQASRGENFLLRKRLAETVKAQTTFYVCHDDTFLYCAARCEGQDPDKLFADATKRDAHRAYKDDVVEFLLDPRHTHDDNYHLIINSKGVIWDAEEHRLPMTETMEIFAEKWNSDAKAAGGRDSMTWVVEVAIPFASLGVETAPAPGTKWGFQAGREKWGADRKESGADTELGLWSRGYGKFDDPKDFGTLIFGGKRTADERVAAWKELPGGDTILDPAKGVRHKYPFTRAFVFGPPDPRDKPRPQMPENLAVVTPDDLYDKTRGYGFETKVIDPHTNCCVRGGFGKPYSPLVRSFIGSAKPARFRMDVPDGDYVLHVISGAPFPMLGRPTDTLLSCGGQQLHLENHMTDKMLVRGDLPVQARGGAGLTLDISTKTTWVLAAMLLYPASDAGPASRCIDDFRREFYRFPLEDHYVKRLWLKLPPEGPDPLPEAEQKAGYALYAVPAAKAVARWHVPQKEDRRGEPLRALAGPGETVNVTFALHAAKPMDGLTLEVVSPHPTVAVKPWIVKQSELPIGRGSLNQWADVPITLWAAEPVYLDAGENQQFFVSLTPKPETPAGVHVGKAVVRWKGKAIGEFPIRLGVLPSAPPEDPKFSDGGYYNSFLFAYERESGQWSQPAWQDLTPPEKEIAIRTERIMLQNLRSHGINTMHLTLPAGTVVELPDGSVKFKPGETLCVFMDLLKETGFTNRPIVFSLQSDYDCGKILTAEAKRAGVEVKERPDRYRLEGKLSKQFLDGITSVVRQIEAERKQRGWPELIYDLWDEPGLVAAKPITEMSLAIRKGGGRNYLTIIPQMAPVMADTLDIRTYNDGPGMPGGQAETPAQVLEFKKKYPGVQWWDYCELCVVLNDRVARFSASYYWWAWNFDGQCPWKLIKWVGDCRNHYDGWDRHPVVPLPNGMLTSTIGWEMAREGKQDRNLLLALEEQADRDKTEAGRAAREFIVELRKTAAWPVRSIAWSDPITGALIEGSRAWPAERFDFNRARLAALMLRLNPPAPATGELQAEAEAIAREAAEREAIRTARRNANLPPRREGNLVKNGDFEMDPTEKGTAPHWSTWSPNARVVSEGAHSGPRCVQLHRDKALPCDNIRAEPIPLTPSRSYQLKAWVKRDAPPDKTDQHTGFWLHTYGDKNDTFFRRLDAWIPKTDHKFDWRQVDLTFAATASERQVVVWFFCGGGAAGDDIWIDDVTLTEMED